MTDQNLLQQRVWQIWHQGQSDAAYAQMLRELSVLEQAYDSVLRELPPWQQNIICDYVSLCEGMSWRMLEIACAATDDEK